MFVFLTVLYASSYRWVHFSRAVLFWRESTESWPRKRQISRCSCRDSNPRPFDHWRVRRSNHWAVSARRLGDVFPSADDFRIDRRGIYNSEHISSLPSPTLLWPRTVLRAPLKPFNVARFAWIDSRGTAPSQLRILWAVKGHHFRQIGYKNADSFWTKWL